jgi:hypothetical protein
MVLGLICSVIFGCSPEVNYSPAAGNNDIAINHYSFGKIVVNGKTYENDIAILADGSVQNWMAQTNHAIQLNDVKALMTGSVKKLIIGIGFNEGCSVTDDIVTYALSKNIELHILDTREAVKLFNASSKDGLTACFHVNC